MQKNNYLQVSLLKFLYVFYGLRHEKNNFKQSFLKFKKDFSSKRSMNLIKLVVVDNLVGHNYPIGSSFKLSDIQDEIISKSGNFNRLPRPEGGPGNTISSKDLAIKIMSSVTKKHIQHIVRSIDSDIKILELRKELLSKMLSDINYVENKTGSYIEDFSIEKAYMKKILSGLYSFNGDIELKVIDFFNALESGSEGITTCDILEMNSIAEYFGKIHGINLFNNKVIENEEDAEELYNKPAVDFIEDPRGIF